jgi:hypothetical protein
MGFCFLTRLSLQERACVPLFQFPAGRNLDPLDGARSVREEDLVVEVHRAAYVVGDDPDGVSYIEIVVPAYPEHTVFLRKPLQNGVGVANDVSEPLEVERSSARWHIRGESLASPRR